MRDRVGDLVMIFPIKKIINTELFIDRLAAIYIRKTRVRVGAKKEDRPVVLADWRGEYTLRRSVILRSKGVRMRDQVGTCLYMSLTVNVNKTEH